MKKTMTMTMKLILTNLHMIFLSIATCLSFWQCEAQDSSYAIHEIEIKPNSRMENMPMDGFHNFAMESRSPVSEESESEIEFEIPEGWSSEPGTGMRAAAFKINDNGQLKEATIVVLPNTNNGYSENIIRWLGQINLKLSDAQLEDFIKNRQGFVTIEKEKGAFFDFTQLQTFGEPNQDYMLASMIDAGSKSIFVKLSGNSDFLLNNKDKFLSLSKSIRLIHGSNSAAQNQVMPLSPNIDPRMQTTDPNFQKVAEGISQITWQTPEEWKSLEASGMRTGSFEVIYNGKKADGSIIQLPGPAGGMENNVRRWMEQIGILPMDDAELQNFLSGQKKIQTADGHEGLLVDLTTLLSGKLTQANTIIAVIISIPGETIFVKLTGPQSVLKQNINALAELSESLKINS